MSNAKYDGTTYFCWLVEKRTPLQPLWLTPHGTWTTNAHRATWFARQCDAEVFADAERNVSRNHVLVCEHGFMADASPHSALPSDKEKAE